MPSGQFEGLGEEGRRTNTERREGKCSESQNIGGWGAVGVGEGGVVFVGQPWVGGIVLGSSDEGGGVWGLGGA